MTISAASHDFNTVHTGGDSILITSLENVTQTTKRRIHRARNTAQRTTLACSIALLALLWGRTTAAAGMSEEGRLELIMQGVSYQMEGAKTKDSYNLSDSNAGEYLADGQRELGYLTITDEQDYANGTHVIWAVYNMTAYNEDTGRRLQVWDCRLTSRCEIIATGALSYARSCAGASTTSNCVKWKRGNALKIYLVSGPKGTETVFTSWCQDVLSPASRILYGELDTGPAYYTDDTYSYGGKATAVIWRLRIE